MTSLYCNMVVSGGVLDTALTISTRPTLGCAANWSCRAGIEAALSGSAYAIRMLYRPPGAHVTVGVTVKVFVRVGVRVGVFVTAGVLVMVGVVVGVFVMVGVLVIVGVL